MPVTVPLASEGAALLGRNAGCLAAVRGWRYHPQGPVSGALGGELLQESSVSESTTRAVPTSTGRDTVLPEALVTFTV